jgi:hypothetical protein
MHGAVHIESTFRACFAGAFVSATRTACAIAPVCRQDVIRFRMFATWLAPQLFYGYMADSAFVSEPAFAIALLFVMHTEEVVFVIGLRLQVFEDCSLLR